MGVNILLECVSAIFILIFYVMSRNIIKYRDYKTKILEANYVMIVLFILFSVSAYIGINIFREGYWIYLNYITCSLGYLGLGLISLIFTLYSISYLYDDEKIVKRAFLLISIPVVIEILALALNPIHKKFFTISYDEGLQIGMAAVYNHVTTVFYIGVNFFLAIKKWKEVNNNVRIGILIYPVISAFALTFHLFFEDLLIMGSVNMMIAVLVNLVMQQRQVQTDDLTNLLSRRVLFKHIALLDIKSRDYKILFVSLKNFQVINNHFGTGTGDKVLIKVGNFLENMMKGYHVYRYNGDEFAILFEADLLKSSDTVVNEIISRFKENWKIEELSYGLNVYMGVLPSDIIRMYVRIPIVTFVDCFIKHIKRLDNDKLIVCNKHIVNMVSRKEAVCYAIHKAINEESFLVYLQPVFDIKENRFVTGEALVRLEDENLGMVYPDEFIPIAEERSLISKIDIIMFEKVCKIIKEMDEQEIDIGGISVNFSIDVFFEGDLVLRIEEILKKYGTAPGKLRIEITETTLAKSYDEVKKIIEQLKKLGILFYLDDFGTGYSNLVSLLKLPFDYIKLDKSFVSETESTTTVKDLVKSICKVFKRRRFEIICEGIETREQLKILEECDLRYVQGYFYARPMPYRKTIEVFKQQENRPFL